MQRDDAKIYSKHFHDELEDLPQFKDDETLLKRLQETCQTSVTRTIGGHDKTLLRFARSCTDILQPGKGENEHEKLRNQNRYLTAVTAFAYSYTYFADADKWSDAQWLDWRDACVKSAQREFFQPNN